jgi:hypothetical protein
MPEFTKVSVQEAMIRTIPGRQGKFINEYADYIQEVVSGEAGKLHAAENENSLTIRRRLISAAKALGINIIIKRSGNELYFWRENGGEEQARSKRRYTRRTRPEEETTAPDQPITEPEEFEQAVSEQTTVSDRV